MFKHNLRVSILTLALLLWGSATAFGQSTAFTYQGKLSDTGNPANGQYDFQFKLFDMQTVGTGNQLGSTVLVPNVTVTAGIFTVQLDFGACASCFNGSARFLEIAVKPTSGPTFTTLGSRQPVTSDPYAIRSLNAGNATTADGLSGACASCVTSSQIGSVNGSAVNGTIPVASVPAGSGSYIQNTTSPQASSNFNISGNGTAAGTLSGNIVNATTQYNIGGSRIMANSIVQHNMFVGVGAGALNSSGTDNAFFGDNAGHSNTSAGSNTFFGASAGASSVTGGANSFFGSSAGEGNKGQENSFFGSVAGISTGTGTSNSFFGGGAGVANTDGNNNTFIGEAAGATNKTGNDNTIIGQAADVGSISLTNANAIGFRALVTQSNSLVLGSINGVNGATADTDVGIGLTAPQNRLTVVDTSGAAQIRFGKASNPGGGYLVSVLGSEATLSGGAEFDGTNWIARNATASHTENRVGAVSFFTDSGLTPGSTFTPSQRMVIQSDGDVGIGINNPADRLHVNGIIRVNTLGAADTTTTLCRNSSNQIATCNSSSLRYKTDIQPFTGGLAIVRRLRPISFTWKQGGSRDLGFGAEEVATVEPLLTFTNEKGQIEGVKYDRINVALVNAIKEEETQIEAQAKAIEREEEQIKQQQLVISSLMKLVCADHRHAHICK